MVRGVERREGRDNAGPGLSLSARFSPDFRARAGPFAAISGHLPRFRAICRDFGPFYRDLPRFGLFPGCGKPLRDKGFVESAQVAAGREERGFLSRKFEIQVFGVARLALIGAYAAVGRAQDFRGESCVSGSAHASARGRCVVVGRILDYRLFAMAESRYRLIPVRGSEGLHGRQAGSPLLACGRTRSKNSACCAIHRRASSAGLVPAEEGAAKHIFALVDHFRYTV